MGMGAYSYILLITVQSFSDPVYCGLHKTFFCGTAPPSPAPYCLPWLHHHILFPWSPESCWLCFFPLLWDQKTRRGWNKIPFFLCLPAVIRLWKSHFPCRILLWRRLRTYFTMDILCFSLPEPWGDLSWIPSWEPGKVPGDEAHKSVEAFLRLWLCKKFSLSC